MPQLHTFSNNFKAVSAFAAAAFTNSTQNGTALDTLANLGVPPRRAALVVDFNTGSATTGNYQLQDSPDNTNWTNVAGATLGSAVVASTQWTQVCDIDLSKRARYLRVQIIGTGTNGNCSATFILYQPEYAAIGQVNAAQTV